jgi:hypothetical protein
MRNVHASLMEGDHPPNARLFRIVSDVNFIQAREVLQEESNVQPVVSILSSSTIKWNTNTGQEMPCNSMRRYTRAIS